MTTKTNTLSLHDALPILPRSPRSRARRSCGQRCGPYRRATRGCGRNCTSPGRRSGCGRSAQPTRSEEHTSELQSRGQLVCRLLLEKKTVKIETNYNKEIK